jgi:hypothetical protein
LDQTATGATPTETAGANPGDITTRDYAGQYDPIADAPTNPANMLAMANAGMGTMFVHLNYANIDQNNAVLQDTVGDTEYYLIPTYPVPLLMPLDMIPVLGPIAADTLDPLVRMLVETGYDRTISPGTPTSADFTYFPNPIQVARNIPVAIQTGLDNGLQDLGAGRPLNTQRPDIAGPGSTGQGAYGIGGPPVTIGATPFAATNSASEGGGQANTYAAQNDPPSPPAPSGTSSTGSNNANLLTNVLTPSLFASPGQTGMSGTKPSQPKLANPVKSVITGVTNSIKAVVKTVTGQKDSPAGDSDPGNANDTSSSGTDSSAG